MAYSPVVEVMQFSSACAFAQAWHGAAILGDLSLPLARKMGLVAIPISGNDVIPLGLI